MTQKSTIQRTSGEIEITMMSDLTLGFSTTFVLAFPNSDLLPTSLLFIARVCLVATIFVLSSEPFKALLSLISFVVT